MKVLFVTAPELNRRSMDSILPPSASMYLTDKLRKNGHSVTQVDLDTVFVQRGELYREFVKHPFVLDHETMVKHLSGRSRRSEISSLGEQLLGAIPDDDYDLIAVSSRRAPGTALIVQSLKQRFQVPVIVGGDPDIDPMEFMSLVPEADFFGMGMGEGPLPELIDALEGRRPIRNVRKLINRVKGRLVLQEGREVTMPERGFADPIGLDINSYLFQRHQFVMVPNPGSRPLIPVQFIQGCPFHCSFCQVSAEGGSKVYRKDPEMVAKEIHHLASLGIRDFAFLNNTLMAGRTYPRRVAEAIAGTGVKLRWSDSASFQNIVEDDLDILADSGCISLTFGLESASPNILKKMLRQYSTEKAARVLKSVQEAGIWTQVNVITGFPGETREDYELTARFVEENARYIGALAVSPFYLVDSQITRHPERFGVRIRNDRKGLGFRHIANSIAFDELDGDKLTYEQHAPESARRAEDLLDRYHRARDYRRGISDLMEVHDVFTYLRGPDDLYAAIKDDGLRFLLFTGAQCTNHCADCPFRDSPPWVTQRSKDDIINAARHARDASYGRVMLVGGEPTRHPDFLDILLALRDMRFREIVMETDGSWIDSRAKAARLRDLGVRRVLFKLQGKSAQEHDEVVKRPGAFTAMVSAMKYAVQAGMQIGKAQPTWLGALSPCMSRSHFRKLRQKRAD